jgi:amidohydrolase
VLEQRSGYSAPTNAFAQHVSPELPVGTIGVRAGSYMASADEIYITIRGEGGHAAAPHQLAADTVLVSAHVITALQSIVSRNSPPGSPSILSIGRVIADGATNVIPSECRMEGTFRAMNEEWRFRAHDLMRRIIEQTANAFGASADVEVRIGYPALHNDRAEAARVRSAALAYVGKENTIDLDMWFASEDFAWFLQAMPGAFFRLGTGGTHETSYPLHTPRFTINEEALRIGTGFMAYLALAYPDIKE